jgi:hypothetical protein
MTKSIRKNKEFTNKEKLIYQIGCRNGFAECEQQTKRILILLKTTNKVLWHELTRLDSLYPLVGPGAVVISLEILRHIVSKLPKSIQYYYRAKLKALIKYPYIKI